MTFTLRCALPIPRRPALRSARAGSVAFSMPLGLAPEPQYLVNIRPCPDRIRIRKPCESLKCKVARTFAPVTDKHANPLILLDLGGSRLDADQHRIAQGLCLGREHLTDDPTNRRKEPEKKNLFLDHFARYYVASM